MNNQYPQQPVQQPEQQYVVQAPPSPVGQLDTHRGLLKFILLSAITFGIYALVVMSKISTDINVIASRYDGKTRRRGMIVGKTNNYKKAIVTLTEDSKEIELFSSLSNK